MPPVQGEERNRLQLQEIYGGPKQGFIIVEGPVVKAVLFWQRLNPEAPYVIRAGDGPKRSAWKATLRNCRCQFDVWIRKGGRRTYTFVGQYRFSSEDPGVQRTLDLDTNDPLRRHATTFTTIRLLPA